MDDDKSTENREAKRTTEARQGEVTKGQPIKWVLVVSTILTALAFLIIYLLFAS